MEEGILRHMSHLSVILTKRKMENSDCEIISFDSALGEALKCLSEFDMSRAFEKA